MPVDFYVASSGPVEIKSLRVLGDLRVSVVNSFSRQIHRRGAENAEVAQRKAIEVSIHNLDA